MKKILVAIKDTSEISRQIVRIAASISKMENTKIFATYVFEVPFSLPLDEDVPEELEKGDVVLDMAEEIAGEFDVPIETHIIQTRVAGSGILDQAKDLESNMIVMGMKHNPVPGEIPIGATTEYVLRSAPCQVLLIRPDIIINE